MCRRWRTPRAAPSSTGSKKKTTATRSAWTTVSPALRPLTDTSFAAAAQSRRRVTPFFHATIDDSALDLALGFSRLIADVATTSEGCAEWDLTGVPPQFTTRHRRA